MMDKVFTQQHLQRVDKALKRLERLADQNNYDLDNNILYQTVVSIMTDIDWEPRLSTVALWDSIYDSVRHLIKTVKLGNITVA
jgi:hypothetical protein